MARRVLPSKRSGRGLRRTSPGWADNADLKPVPGAIEKLKSLRTAGHTVILFTARHMKTCSGNVGDALVYGR